MKEMVSSFAIGFLILVVILSSLIKGVKIDEKLKLLEDGAACKTLYLCKKNKEKMLSVKRKSKKPKALKLSREGASKAGASKNINNHS
jgi:hypothetical protein